MDEGTFTERAKRLRKINAVIVELDEAIRADAFELLKPYTDAEAEGVAAGKPDDDSKKRRAAGPRDEDSLIEKHESDTDSENALLALALFYARYGKGPFAMPRLNQLAAGEEPHDPEPPRRFLQGPQARRKRGPTKARRRMESDTVR